MSSRFPSRDGWRGLSPSQLSRDRNRERIKLLVNFLSRESVLMVAQLVTACSNNSALLCVKISYSFNVFVVGLNFNLNYSGVRHATVADVPGGGYPQKLGGDVLLASQNPYPNYDQILRYSLPYL